MGIVSITLTLKCDKCERTATGSSGFVPGGFNLTHPKPVPVGWVWPGHGKPYNCEILCPDHAGTSNAGGATNG